MSPPRRPRRMRISTMVLAAYGRHRTAHRSHKRVLLLFFLNSNPPHASPPQGLIDLRSSRLGFRFGRQLQSTHSLSVESSPGREDRTRYPKVSPAISPCFVRWRLSPPPASSSLPETRRRLPGTRCPSLRPDVFSHDCHHHAMLSRTKLTPTVNHPVTTQG